MMDGGCKLVYTSNTSKFVVTLSGVWGVAAKLIEMKQPKSAS